MSKYGEWKKNYLKEYHYKNIKKLSAIYQRSFFERFIEPAIKQSGLKESEFAKRAIAEKIARDYPSGKRLYYIRLADKDILATYAANGTIKWCEADSGQSPAAFLAFVSSDGVNDSDWDSAETNDVNEFFSGSEILAEAILFN